MQSGTYTKKNLACSECFEQNPDGKHKFVGNKKRTRLVATEFWRNRLTKHLTVIRQTSTPLSFSLTFEHTLYSMKILFHLLILKVKISTTEASYRVVWNCG